MKTIFVLDDSPIVSGLLKQELESTNQYNVYCFDNGDDLLANLSRNPDLIILDYYLDAYEDGLFMLRSIKKMDKTIPVVMFSGQSNLKTAVTLIRAGAVDYVNKNDDDFLENIMKAVNGVFEFNETRKELASVEKTILVEGKQLRIIGLVGAVILFSLFWML